MIGGQRSELELFTGEELYHQPFEALVECPIAAAGIGEDETSLFDKFAEVGRGLGRKIRRFVAVEESNGRLEHLLKVGVFGVDDLPGEEVFPVLGDDGDDVANVVRVVVPVLEGRMAEL